MKEGRTLSGKKRGNKDGRTMRTPAETILKMRRGEGILKEGEFKGE